MSEEQTQPVEQQQEQPAQTQEQTQENVSHETSRKGVLVTPFFLL